MSVFFFAIGDITSVFTNEETVLNDSQVPILRNETNPDLFLKKFDS